MSKIKNTEKIGSKVGSALTKTKRSQITDQMIYNMIDSLDYVIKPKHYVEFRRTLASCMKIEVIPGKSLFESLVESYVIQLKEKGIKMPLYEVMAAATFVLSYFPNYEYDEEIEVKVNLKIPYEHEEEYQRIVFEPINAMNEYVNKKRRGEYE